MTTDNMIERIARAIAEANGDDFDDIPRDKGDWTRKRGEFGGRFRDVNEPYQSDYLNMAELALTRLRIPSDAMERAGNQEMEDAGGVLCHDTALRCWTAMIDKALEDADG